MEHWPIGKPAQDATTAAYLEDTVNQIPRALLVYALNLIADLLGMIPVVGGTLEELAENIADGINQSYDAANSAQQTGVDNSAAISEIQSGLSGAVGGSGFTYSYPFDGSALDSNWTTYDPNGTGTQVGGGQVEPDDNATGNIFHLMETALPGDDFEISFTLGDNNSHGTECTGLCFASNADMTDFARIYTFDDEIYLGRSTRPNSTSNSVTTYDWASNTSQSFSPGKICKVRKVGTNYKVWVSGSLIFNHTNVGGDPGGVKTTGASYRYTGLQQEYDGSLFHGRSAGVAHFTVADYTAPTYPGTGWRLSRANTANTSSTTWASGFAALNSSTFDTTDRIHGSASVISSGTGIVRVTRADFYFVEAAVEFGSGAAVSDKWVGVKADASNPPTTLVGRSNPSAADTTHDHTLSGNTGLTVAGGTNHSHSSTSINVSNFTVAGSIGVRYSGWVYLNANDYVQIVGGGVTSNSQTVRGDATGTKTYFAGISRS